MRKFILLIVVSLMGGIAMAQEPLIFEHVVTKEGKTAKDFYETIKRWTATRYTSAQDVIQLDNPDKEITLKAVIPFEVNSLTWHAASGYISYTVDFLIKDNRFKIIIGPFIHVSTEPRFGKDWSNGVVYKDSLTNDFLKSIGHGGLKKKQYRAIDKRVRPLTRIEIESITSSLIQELENVGVKRKNDWDF